MEETGYKRRRGSLVVPILLILIGMLLLLDNLNIISGIDWSTIWKLWPIVLIAIGLEIILGRRVSFGAILLLVLVVVIGGAVIGWSLIGGTGDRTTERVTFPMGGTERARLEIDVGVGELQLAGYGDMSDLLVADLDLVPGVDVDSGTDVENDTARVWLRSDKDIFSWPQIFGGSGSEWDVRLNDGMRWEINVNAGVGEADLDLSGLRVSNLVLDSGIGSVSVTLPRRGITQARIDGGIGDVTVEVPLGTQARFKVDRGISDLTVGSRFERHGDYYETEGFSRSESYIEMEIDIGIGSVTVR